MAYATRKGREEGRAEGKAEGVAIGKTDGKAELVAEMLGNGADWGLITRLTQITPEEFERMKAQTK